ncbi:cupin domain-containing protein [Tellurirhabdus bombi]|uniref:cupin domain-containing protein n=1 Tax=Tellurirhabdus bombi TaxID=2907205 RepID=UPI001F455088|nr:cupin domain-containing protein [Tellurirhabdus bombi]
MKTEAIIRQLENLKPALTSHQIGQKTVLVTHEQCESPLMQAAVGTLTKGEAIEAHAHETMEEFYFFEEGDVLFTIAGQQHKCVAGTFVKVPARVTHDLLAQDDSRFIYWGVALG